MHAVPRKCCKSSCTSFENACCQAESVLKDAIRGPWCTVPCTVFPGVSKTQTTSAHIYSRNLASRAWIDTFLQDRYTDSGIAMSSVKREK